MSRKAIKNFEYGDAVETTIGSGVFVDYSNGGQSYKVYFTDGKHKGSELSIGESGIKSSGRTSKKPRLVQSKYAPYDGNEDVFDKPVDFSKDGMVEFLTHAKDWILIISSSPDSIDVVAKDLEMAGLDNPTNYIRRSAPDTHGAKYDLLIPDPDIPNIDLQLGLFFNPIRLSSTGRYQIGRKEFVLHVLPKIRVLEIGERLSY